MSQSISINDEFRDRLPPLERDEREKLRQLILDEGEIRNPLIYWKQTNELVDGHNRQSIYQELCEQGHKVKPPTYKAMSFASKDDAFRWMDDNARGTRSLNKRWREILIGREYNATKKDDGKRGPAKKPGQTDQAFDSTGEKVAKKHGLGEKTVRRFANRAGVFDAVASELGPDSEEAIEVLKVSQKVIDAATEKIKKNTPAPEVATFIKKQKQKLKREAERQKEKQGISPPSLSKKKRTDTSGLSPFRRDVKKLLSIGRCDDATFWKNVQMLQCSSGSEQARKNRHWFKTIVAEVPGLELKEHDDDTLEMLSHNNGDLIAAIYHEAKELRDAFKSNFTFEPATVRAKAKKIIELLSPYIS